MESISAQVIKLDEELDDVTHRPDIVVILNEGIVGPRGPIRNGPNYIRFPTSPEERAAIRATKGHTWMRFCLQLARELGAIQLPPLELSQYLRMPELIGSHRVAGHDRLVRRTKAGVSGPVRKLNAHGVRRIVELGAKNETTWDRHLEAVAQACGTDKSRISRPQLQGSQRIRVFNPRNLSLGPGRDPKQPHFISWSIWIDGIEYLVDTTALTEQDLDETDTPLGDLFE